MKHFLNVLFNRPVSVMMIFFGVILFGILSLRNLPVRMLPHIPVPRLTVLTLYPGYPPEKIRTLVSIPLEEAFSSLQGIQTIRSASVEGKSILTLDFHWGTDMDMAGIETREIIDNATGILPTDVEKPIVLSLVPGEEALIWIGVSPLDGDLSTARKLCTTELQSRIQRIDGVASVVTFGGSSREIHITPDRKKATAYGLSLSYIFQYIRQAHVHYPAGKITEGELEYVIKTDARITTLEGFKQLPIPSQGRREPYASFVPLSEIATVKITTAEQQSAFHLNGNEGIVLLVYGRRGFSPVSLSKKITQELPRLQKTFEREVSLQVIKDVSVEITRSVRSLSISALLGGGIVFIVILLFLRSVSLGAVLLSSFPWSLCFCFIFLYISGRSINIMSLGGLVIGMGMIVDNGIVVTEKLVESDTPDGSVAEILPSLVGSTLTTIVVFIPLLFLPGIIGSLYTDLALSVAFSLIGSLFGAVMIIPVVFTYVERRAKRTGARRLEKSRWHGKRLQFAYGRFLSFFIRKPHRLIPVLLTLIVLGGVALLRVEIQLYSPLPGKELSFHIELPPDVRFQELARCASLLSKHLYRSGEFTYVTARCGVEKRHLLQLADYNRRPEIVEITACCTGRNISRARLFVEDIGSSFSAFPVKIEYRPRDYIRTALELSFQGGKTIMVTGDTRKEAEERAQNLVTATLTPLYQGFSVHSTLPELGNQETKTALYLYPKRDLFARYGLSLYGVAREIHLDLAGMRASSASINGTELDLRIIGEKDGRKNGETFQSIPLLVRDGQHVPLGSLFHIEKKSYPQTFLREDKKDYVPLVLHGFRDLPKKIQKEIIQLVKGKKGTSFSDKSTIHENLRQIVFIFSASLLLVYFILGAQFESFFEPFIVFTPLPFSAAGVLLSLWIFGKTADMYTSLGFLVLLGLSINNSIFLFAAYKRNMQNGISADRAVYTGSLERIRPITMTTLTTVTALLPLAIDPLRNASQSGMAAAVIGGLSVSTIVSIFFQPFMFKTYSACTRKLHARNS